MPPGPVKVVVLAVGSDKSINTGSGTATLVGNTGVTLLGAATVAAGASGLWRLRKTGTATYVALRFA